MTKLTLEKFYEANNHYKELQRKANDFYKELKEMNNNLDLNEVRKKCTYSEVKEIYDLMKYCTSDKSVVEEVSDIMASKKEEEYPEILGVHYFPEILELDFLSEKEQIQLDDTLRTAYSSYRKRLDLIHLEKDVLEALIEKGILEKEYLLSCGCSSMECSPVRISKTKLDKYIKYWEDSQEREMSEDEDNELNYGCIEIPCFYDTIDEICSLEEFNDYSYKEIQYVFKKEPDLTLEVI